MSDRLFVSVPPDWKGSPPFYPIDLEPPPEHQWLKGRNPPPVFIGQCCVPNGAEAYLFGIRHALSDVKGIAPSRANSYFIEFIVQEVIEGVGALHRLRQHRNVTYSKIPESGDSLLVKKMKKSEVRSHCIGDLPEWNRYDAEWPTLTSKPMQFVAQFRLVENDTTRKFLTWNTAVFLFWTQFEVESTFKITSQEIDYQSASDHYASESRD